MINLTSIQRTYDQVSIPADPIIGAIWTERDSADNIEGTWYWNGVLWLSTNIITKTANVFQDIGGSIGYTIGIATNTYCIEAFVTGRISSFTPHTLANHIKFYMFEAAEDFSFFNQYLILNTTGLGPENFNVKLPVNQAFTTTPSNYIAQISPSGFNPLNTTGVTIGVRYRLIRT